MNLKEFAFIDTDILIHRLSPDDAVRRAAEHLLKEQRPTAMSEFSIVEFKAAYLQRLILLSNKVAESDSFHAAIAKINKSKDRAVRLMIGQLALCLDLNETNIHPWPEARHQIIIQLDLHIGIAWQEFQRAVDRIVTVFQCTRAKEGPREDGERWQIVNHNCRKDNTTCTITSFMRQHLVELSQLVEYFERLDPQWMTDTLYKIKHKAQKTVETGEFPWEGTTCRSLGDLLIGLTSLSGRELWSSNYKEHIQLSSALGYNYKEFDVVKIRKQSCVKINNANERRL